MATATQRPVTLRVGQFQVESLGVEWPDYFQGYGLGPRSTFHYCAYGIGDTEEEAFQDCLEMVAQRSRIFTAVHGRHRGRWAHDRQQRRIVA